MKKSDVLLTNIAAIVENLNNTLENAKAPAGASLQAITQLSATADIFPRLTNAASELVKTMEKSSLVVDEISNSADALPRQLESIDSFSKAATESLRRVAEEISSAAREAASLRHDSTEAGHSILVAKELLNSSHELKTTLSGFDSTISALSQTVKQTNQALLETSGAFKNSLSSSALALDSDVRKSSAAATLLTDKLVEVAQVVIDRTSSPKNSA